MTKAEFIKKLRSSLGSLKKAELKRTLEYYSELIDDRIEAGESEAAAVNALGNIDEIAKQILADAAEEGNLRPKRRPVHTALLIIGSPLWLVLLIAAIAVIFAIYAAIWSCLIMFIAADFALAVSGPAMMLSGAFSGELNAVLLMIGGGAIATALGLALFYPMQILTKACIKLSKWGGIMIGNFFKRLFKTEVN